LTSVKRIRRNWRSSGRTALDLTVNRNGILEPAGTGAWELAGYNRRTTPTNYFSEREPASCNRGMAPAERRRAALKLIAEIDQRIAECRSLLADPLLWTDEPEFVEAQLAVRIDALRRSERLLRRY
jgi:hypothetical protein